MTTLRNDPIANPSTPERTAHAASGINRAIVPCRGAQPAQGPKPRHNRQAALFGAVRPSRTQVAPARVDFGIRPAATGARSRHLFTLGELEMVDRIREARKNESGFTL